MKIQRNPFQSGFTLIELLLVVAISGMLIVSVSSLINPALQAESASRQQNENLQEARFAMQQMVRMVSESHRLLIPFSDNPSTAWSESVRDILAVNMPEGIDRDKDGWADADNDKDGKVDEDPGGDLTNDSASGIIGIDDDGDGLVDEAHSGSGPAGEDDDEDGAANEDGWNDIDDDGDSATDEDPKKDMSDDGKAGIIGVDDDGDSVVDEGDKNDDDEDGSIDEDWFDPVVFFLSGTTLMQRIPNLNPTDGTDYGEYPVADNVSNFRVERLIGGDGTTVLVDITLELTPSDVDPVSLNTRIRLGGRL